ncbi:MAG: AbrB/MazE/SpoVT family DNA-binding domain-containing protein [Betaproteobacteria bacterium]
MTVATLTGKGQTAIPKKIRDLLGIKPGDKPDFIIENDGKLVLHPVTRDVRELRGLLYVKGRKPVSLEQMEAAVAAGARRARK